ncbi:MAG: FAD-dependent thymidylate synthase [Syntrophaceae bacterium]|nr:FAD-dependent thymidylate synthase [Syntrophaceae bacterium]
MDIILAGYNLDYETIRSMGEALPELISLTPETVSAAYARISRSPKPVDELRAIARTEVEKARQSNQNIVFEMGHSSIAEHAVFNIDVIGVSRLLVEEIEKFRLCSYTEKSQRYVLLSDDFVIPEEIRNTGMAEQFVQLVQKQNAFYHKLYDKLRPHVFAKHPDLAEDPKNRGLLEGWAKEDARYILSMATQTQLGMTLNARNLELVMRRMAAHPLAEANEYGQKLHNVIKPIAPSLIRYTEKTDYDTRTGPDLKDKLGLFLKSLPEAGKTSPQTVAVSLIHTTPEADNRVLAAFVHTTTDRTATDCLQMASALSPDQKEEIFRTAFRHMKSHDASPRELECVDLTYDLIVSASCFAQLKRHRMATLLSQNYDPNLGVTIPESIQEVGMATAFGDMIGQTEDFYHKLLDAAPLVASYGLTNAHRKRVLMKINARELYHIARLRADRHAQWDIRNLAKEMIAQARAVMPLTLMMAIGKDDFATRREEIYND